MISEYFVSFLVSFLKFAEYLLVLIVESGKLSGLFVRYPQDYSFPSLDFVPPLGKCYW